MKKLFSRKAVGILIVAAIILGSTAALGYAMVSAQAAANAALDSQPIAQLEAPLPTPRPPSVTPQPKDLSEDSAIDIAISEIQRVFGQDVSQGDFVPSFNLAEEVLASENGRCAWFISITVPEYVYRCELDSVTGAIASMRRESLIAPVIETPEEAAMHDRYRKVSPLSRHENGKS